MLARPAVDGARERHRRPTSAHACSRSRRPAGSSPPAAHLHGGAQSLELNQPRCKDRTLVVNRPAYAPAGDPLYKVRPLLHEPDPKNISWWQSATGWPIAKGEKLEVTAAYDNTRPHTRVMGIEHIYVAPPLDAKAAARLRRGPARRRRARRRVPAPPHDPAER